MLAHDTRTFLRLHRKKRHDVRAPEDGRVGEGRQWNSEKRLEQQNKRLQPADSSSSASYSPSDLSVERTKAKKGPGVSCVRSFAGVVYINALKDVNLCKLKRVDSLLA